MTLTKPLSEMVCHPWAGTSCS